MLSMFLDRIKITELHLYNDIYLRKAVVCKNFGFVDDIFYIEEYFPEDFGYGYFVIENSSLGKKVNFKDLNELLDLLKAKK
ncbi:MAG: hypothetical protein H0Z24_03145 [Thermosipho sp. (in: Bacteria)]|nr:hypothetical protein [Thermosipho sp. (in: thermotogales)]